MAYQVLKLVERKSETTALWCHKNSWIFYLLLVTFETVDNYSIRNEITLFAQHTTNSHPMY